MKTLTRTRRRKIASAVVAVFLIAVASASAYYLIFANGSGEGSAQLGSGSTAETLPLTATFAAGLTPGHEEALTYKAVNTTKSMARVTSLVTSISIDATHTSAGCKAEWFSTEGEGGLGAGGGTLNTPVTVAVGETKELGKNMTLKFREEATVNQSACEGATLTIHMTSTP